MLYYLECRRCKRRGQLLRADTAPTTIEKCPTPECQKAEASEVVVHPTNVYVQHCEKCGTTSGLCSDATYADHKASPPACLKCATAPFVILLPAHLDTKATSLAKRKKPGLIAPKLVEKLPQHGGHIEEEIYEPISRKRKADDSSELREPAERPLTFEFEPAEGISLMATAEARYKKRVRFQKDFDKKHGPLTDAVNPQKSSQHTGGRVVPFKTYEANLSDSAVVEGKKYPKPNKSGPTIVNAANIFPRDTTWDYRELGPCSLLRRISSLLYVMKISTKDSDNPVEVQAMWAAGSLFLSSNNYTFTEYIYGKITGAGSIKDVVAAIVWPSDAKMTKEEKEKKRAEEKSDPRVAEWRNFSPGHQAKLKEYQDDLVKDRLPSYFQYKWDYVVEEIRLATQGKTQLNAKIAVEPLVVNNATGGFEHWTVGRVERGRVYLVVPNHSRTDNFQKKKVHAEQLFFPILMQLRPTLSAFAPAFVGGVKTACRTCSEVLAEAARQLGDKLVLPTDAFGHYWPASGMHVPGVVFDPAKESIVFGSDTTSDSIYNTEMPWSPTHD